MFICASSCSYVHHYIHTSIIILTPILRILLAFFLAICSNTGFDRVLWLVSFCSPTYRQDTWLFGCSKWCVSHYFLWSEVTITPLGVIICPSFTGLSLLKCLYGWCLSCIVFSLCLKYDDQYLHHCTNDCSMLRSIHHHHNGNTCPHVCRPNNIRSAGYGSAGKVNSEEHFEAFFWLQACATATTASVLDVLSRIYHLYHGSFTGRFLFQRWTSHFFYFMCLVSVMLFAFYFNVPR